uniref:Uncharacterized protein LOC102809843 n=1 Tax=Saccoglossus kowalevskii TaxID=10224 RepID=A0ABM0MJK5_SACKO|nr:PREDICTED: uncharacterized protein LOC102809843 [Saccoglossus kowalevskii]
MGVAVLLIILLIIALILMVIRAKQKLRELDEDVRMRSHQRSVQAMMQAEKRKLYDKMSTQMAPPNRQYSHGSTNTLPISDVLYFKARTITMQHRQWSLEQWEMRMLRTT